jgi:formylglycine-generating enzyme required for sulfatase activity
VLGSFALLAAVLSGLTAQSPGPPSVTDEASGMRLVWIPPGEFDMGTPPGAPGRQIDERLHRVRLTRGFWLGSTEVTQREWTRVMGRNPSRFSRCGPDCPVENVRWYDVRDFLARLNARSPGGFRLPTEAEWEYACRAGNGSGEPYSTGSTLPSTAANFDRRSTVRVGSYPPNAWGLFDMHGNVWEWCADWYGPYEAPPSGEAVRDPAGPERGEKRVIRGGSFYFGADSCRCALRYTHRPGDRGPSLGFRVARDASPR